MKFISENKAQSGAVFRLMVDGIIGLVIFTMIVASLSYFQSLRVETSQAELFTLLTSAKNSSNGTVFRSSGDLLFAKGRSFTTTGLRNIIGLYEECFSFESNLGFAKLIDNSAGESVGIEFKDSVEARVYTKCEASTTRCEYGEEGCCEINCVISFGKILKSEVDYE